MNLHVLQTWLSEHKIVLTLAENVFKVLLGRRCTHTLLELIPSEFGKINYTEIGRTFKDRSSLVRS